MDEKMKRQVLKLLIPMFAAACLVSAQSDYDHGVDFNHYKTYSWIGATVRGANASNDLWAKRIERDVDQELAAEGWTKVQAGGDAVVSAFGRAYNERTLATYYNGLGGDWLWRGVGGGTTANPPVGSLVVDVFDAQTKKLIWRGTSRDTVAGKPDTSGKTLKKSLDDMFKSFPQR